ncbi:MAG: DUF4124 domain-containing protein [Proteobacteria bacterium]|nr:DUF4124 domain-containing protein [Pseudomonadota bacterium]
MFNKILITTLLTIQLFCLNTAYSEVYKWTDEDGKVVYGDKPASNNADKIIIKNTTPKQDKHFQERQKKQQKLLDVLQEERNEKIALKKEEKEKKEKQKCAEIRKELQETKNASHLYEKTDDPNNPKIVSDERRKIVEEKYKNYIKENC